MHADTTDTPSTVSRTIRALRSGCHSLSASVTVMMIMHATINANLQKEKNITKLLHLLEDGVLRQVALPGGPLGFDRAALSGTRGSLPAACPRPLRQAGLVSRSAPPLCKLPLIKNISCPSACFKTPNAPSARPRHNQSSHPVRVLDPHWRRPVFSWSQGFSDWNCGIGQ